METNTYYYPVKYWNQFVLTENKKKLQHPTDLQFYIESLILQFDQYIKVSPFLDRKHIKVIIEKDKDFQYRTIDELLRDYVMKHY